MNAMSRKYFRWLFVMGILSLVCQLAFSQVKNSFNDIIDRVERQRNFQPSNMQNTVGGKCGLWQSFEVMQHWQEFTPDQRQRLTALLAPQAMQKDRVIGRFHIYYDTTGGNAPTLLDGADHPIAGTAEAYVDSVGKIFNDVWEFEVNGLLYLSPPLEADSTYHIFISNIDIGGFYGETLMYPTPINQGIPSRFQTYIIIDNDFRFIGYPSSRGIPGLKVTAAHEFHHAIQIGAYGFWGDAELYFYEITSTWMEDVVYGDVNDYYQYLSNNPNQSSQFSQPNLRFSAFNQSIQYSRSVWGKFLEKRYSRDLMRTIWNYMRQYPSLEANDHALADAGSSLREAYLEYAYWNFNTGPNADTVRYYTEGRHYPAMRLTSMVDYTAPERSLPDTIQAISSSYHRICVLSSPTDSCNAKNEMDVIISNVNIPAGMLDNNYAYTYKLSQSETQGSTHLANGLYSSLLVADQQNWNAQENVPSIVNDILVFPNPYVVQNGKRLWFRFPETPQRNVATLSIFSSSLDKILSNDMPVVNFRSLEPALVWDGRDDNSSLIATGIYFYVIAVDDKQYMGKFSVIRQ
jgi:hypothetical protein